MPKISAILHTHNDAQRIGRALESLRAVDEMLVIDNGSTDDTRKIARQHGANVKKAVPGVNPGVYAVDAHHDWILCLLPSEAAGDSLEAALFEWKQQQKEEAKDSDEVQIHSYKVQIREETESGWETRAAETRLVNRKQINWNEALPPNDPASPALAGEIVRFHKP